MILPCKHDSEMIYPAIADSTAKGGCAVCWSYLNAPGYQEHYSNLKAIDKVSEKLRSPCVHIGEPTGESIKCGPCGGNVQIKTLICSIHNQCTIAKKLDGISCCAICTEYEAELS